MNLVVCFKEVPVADYLIERIGQVWQDVDIINVGQDRIAEVLLDADYFCGHAKVPVDWDKIVSQGRLKWIQSSAAGMDWCLVPSVINSEITITTASGVLADQVAEHTLGLIISWMRNLPVFLDEQHNKQTPDYRKFIRRPTRDLTNSTVGIVGFGGVGRRLSQVLAPFKTRIIATDLFPESKPPHVAELWGANRLDDLLDQSDIVILCLPLNSATKNLFDKNKFKQMNNTALFVNVARGQLVVTSDLVDALEAGSIAGAVIDVTSPEPLPSASPLWDFNNVIITPHVAGQFHRRFDNVVDIFIENIKRYKNGEKLINYLTPEGKKFGFPLREAGYPLWIDYKENFAANVNNQ
ncbi:MAG: D-2-hydroxyacid dehydrogenase [Planctomycetaceae bacterium]|jgi:D-3-phosphoglycerate dehydrogenase|nr:D-2-hydroxyacid dehydrogenase [Planctomycetaceae bacterium]